MSDVYFPMARLEVKLKKGRLSVPHELQNLDIIKSSLLGYNHLEVHPQNKDPKFYEIAYQRQKSQRHNDRRLRQLFTGGLILIPLPFLDHAGLEPNSRVKVVGLEDHFEIWNPGYLGQLDKELRDILYQFDVRHS